MLARELYIKRNRNVHFPVGSGYYLAGNDLHCSLSFLAPRSATHCGRFSCAQSTLQRVHVYEAVSYEGEPTESEEMRPRWFHEESLPIKVCTQFQDMIVSSTPRCIALDTTAAAMTPLEHDYFKFKNRVGSFSQWLLIFLMNIKSTLQLL